MKMNSIIRKRIIPILLAIAMLFGISVVAIAAGGNGGGGGNAGIQSNMAGTGFQFRLNDPDVTMAPEGGTYILDGEYDASQDIVFSFIFNPNGGQRGFGIYPALNGEPAGFDGVIIFDKADTNKTPILSLGGNYSQETMNSNFYFEEIEDSGYKDHLVFAASSSPTPISNEKASKLTIKADSLQSGKTYCLYFPKTIKTFNNGSAKQLGSDVSIEFTTAFAPDPEAPYVEFFKANSKVPPSGISVDDVNGFAQVDDPSKSDPIGFEARIGPRALFADNYAEDNYKQFSLSSYYGDDVNITVGPGRVTTTKTYSFYKIDMSLSEPGWYCLSIGKDFKNDAGKTIGDYTGGKDWTYWIVKSYSTETREFNVDLTKELEKISFQDVSAANSKLKANSVSMVYEDPQCPDYLVKLTPDEGYVLPDEVSITTNGKELTAGKDYTYTPETLQKDKDKNGGEHEYNLKVDRHAISGPVVIKASAVKPVTNVVLDKTELTLDEKTTEVLAATVSPEDATNKNVSWSSSDEAVATVDKDGKVTALKAGTATITATTEDGEKTATCAVTVKHVEEILPAKEPTCTEPGLTEGKKCSACGEVLKEQEEIPALGHDYKDGVCTRCGQKDPNYVEPTTKPEEPTTQKEEPSSTTTTTKKQEEPSSTTTTTKKQEEPSSTTTTTKKQEEPSSTTTTTKKAAEPVAVKETRIVKKNPSDGKWYLYTNGSIDWRYTGIAPNQYGWWRIKNGKVDFNATGVFRNEYGWWRVEDGKVNFNAQGIYKNAYGWWKTKDGKVTFDETGVFRNEYGWWRVEDSKVNFNANSIYKNQYGWWKTTDGKVTFQENGIFKNQHGTWYVKNSKVDFNKNGTVKYNGKTYKVIDGKAKLA